MLETLNLVSCMPTIIQCEGGQPCLKCVQQQTECVLDHTQDRRKKTHQKKKGEEANSERLLSRKLLQVIRFSGDEVVSELVKLIRNGHPQEALWAFLEQELDQLAEFAIEGRESDERRSLDSQTSIQRPRSRRNVLDIWRLSDSPLFRVPARPWTTVIDDDDLVSHLISSWFAWHHIWFN